MINLENKKILITGAGGFIGSHLALKLHQQGEFIRVADIKWDGYLEEPYYTEKLPKILENPPIVLRLRKILIIFFTLQQTWEVLDTLPR